MLVAGICSTTVYFVQGHGLRVCGRTRCSEQSSQLTGFLGLPCSHDSHVSPCHGLLHHKADKAADDC